MKSMTNVHGEKQKKFIPMVNFWNNTRIIALHFHNNTAVVHYFVNKSYTQRTTNEISRTSISSNAHLPNNLISVAPLISGT